MVCGGSPRIDHHYNLDRFSENNINNNNNNNNNDNNNGNNNNTTDNRNKKHDSTQKEEDAVMGEVKVIKELICEMSRQDEIEEEYHILARVLNRMCFVVFLVTYVVSSCTMLLPAYLEHLYMNAKPRGGGEDHHQ